MQRKNLPPWHIATLATICLIGSSVANERTDFATIVHETGCGSRDGDRTFAAKYKDRLFIAQGEITDIANGTVALKLLKSTRTYDIRVNLASARDAEFLQVGQTISISFVMRSRGTCSWGYSGDEGTLYKDFTPEGDFRE